VELERNAHGRTERVSSLGRAKNTASQQSSFFHVFPFWSNLVRTQFYHYQDDL